MALCKFIPIFSEYYKNCFKYPYKVLKTSEHIQKLITLLSNASIDDYSRLLNDFDFDSVDFEPFQSWSSQKYTRNCLYRDANFELILLCWEKGQETAVHGHNGEDCWVYLLDGEMEEVLFALDDLDQLSYESSQKIISHQLTFMNDKIGFHKLKNTNQGRSISLHLYAKPIERCHVFDESSRQFKERVLTFDTFKQLVLED